MNNSLSIKEQHADEQCNKRHDAEIAWKKDKAGKSKLKRWFYLGNEKESYYTSLYDKLKYKAFLKWKRNLEKHGVNIKREYFYKDKNKKFGIENYKIYNTRNWDNPWRPFCFKWVGAIKDDILSFFKYDSHICNWDEYDIINFLIVNLTIKGMYFGLHGMSVDHKDQMHKCWDIRAKLIKAYNYEEYFDYYVNQKEIYNKYGIEKNIVFFNEDDFIKEGKFGDLISMGANRPFTSSCCSLKDIKGLVKREPNESDFDYNTKIVKKVNEINDFEASLSKKNNEFIVSKNQVKLMKEAFSCLGKDILGLWD